LSEDTKLPHLNKGAAKASNGVLYCKEAKELVLDIYQEDFEVFGYSCELK